MKNKTELKEVELIFEDCNSLNKSRGLVIDKNGYARDFHMLSEEDIANKNYKIVTPALICAQTKEVVATAWQITDFFPHLSPYNLGCMKDSGKGLIQQIFVELEHTVEVLPEKPKGKEWKPVSGEAMAVMYERVKLVDNKVIIYVINKWSGRLSNTKQEK